jgi:hypothetical protein
MLLVAIFTDENSQEDLDLLFTDLEETSCEKVLVFDDGNKVVMRVPDEIPDPDFVGTIEEYWMFVMNDSRCPCCHPSEESDVSAVHEVKTLKQFREYSNRLNNGEGPYEELLKDLKD